MKNWIPTFGIEIHAELLTNTKAFSPSKIDFDAEPNTMIHPVDMGYPGAKPTVNRKMVEFGYRLASVLKMDIAEVIAFDRKAYFYPDLPKGFQITQFFKPIGTNGKFTITSNGVEKDISITEIHMEEDTAKQIKTDEGILFDFNRAGVPLIEIVSGHEELSSVADVIAYVKQMREQLVIMGINDGKLEEGSFRVDVNVSIREEGTEEFGTRTEVKNLNSFRNIERALEVEIERHKKIYEEGGVLESTTVRYDEDTNTTHPMRLKDTGYDYNFIPEGNINPIILNEETLNEFKSKSDLDITVSEFRNEWKEKMNEDELSVILSTKELLDLFIDLSSKADSKDVINFIVNNIKSMINESKLKVFRFDSEEIIGLISLRKEGKVNNKETNKLVSKMFEESISKDIESLKNKVLLTEEEIKGIISNLISSNKDMVDKDINDRPERVEKFLMGQLMKETKGQASPQLANKLIKEVLWED